MTCCGVERPEGRGGGRVEEEEKVEGRGTGRVVVGVGGREMRGVRWSCRVALVKLTPHSPDQSRQVGGRDGPAPRREEQTHC